MFASVVCSRYLGGMWPNCSGSGPTLSVSSASVSVKACSVYVVDHSHMLKSYIYVESTRTIQKNLICMLKFQKLRRMGGATASQIWWWRVVLIRKQSERIHSLTTGGAPRQSSPSPSPCPCPCPSHLLRFFLRVLIFPCFCVTSRVTRSSANTFLDKDASTTNGVEKGAINTSELIRWHDFWPSQLRFINMYMYVSLGCLDHSNTLTAVGLSSPDFRSWPSHHDNALVMMPVIQAQQISSICLYIGLLWHHLSTFWLFQIPEATRYHGKQIHLMFVVDQKTKKKRLEI